MRGLYRGMASPLVGVGGINAVIFGVQRYTNRLFTNQDALSLVLCNLFMHKLFKFYRTIHVRINFHK